MKITIEADDYCEAFAALISVREALRGDVLPRPRARPALMVPVHRTNGPATKVWGTKNDVKARRVKEV